MAIMAPSLQEITTNVELFNNLTLDDSKAMFKSCLGTDFPYDVGAITAMLFDWSCVKSSNKLFCWHDR